MFESLSGQKVVIIGINSGVDLAIAKKTAELGASVVLSHYSQDKLNEAMESLPGEIETKIVDIVQEDSVNAFFEEIGNFDHLVVTSMGDRNMPRSLLAEMSTETAQGAMQKFWGTFFAVRASLKNIATNGSITLTSSVTIFKSSKMGGISVIAAANSAVALFGRSLALEISPIRVNVVAPGLLEDSSIWSSQGESERADLTKWATTALPVEHLGQPEEFAQAVLSLITNPYITGVVLPMDGGVTLL
ncbi:MAG: SDR family oxidoreductase [Symploca sp. SIO1B1]|nr:SDR family oxidoreductase [Symploca sp. SIO1B1]